MNIFDFLGSATVFLATLIAVRGGTWNSTRRRFFGLTKIGAIAVTVGVVGFGASIYATYSSRQEEKQMID